MKSIVSILSLVLAVTFLGVLPVGAPAAEIEKVSTPDLSMLQGTWEGTWERTGARKKHTTVTLRIKGKNAVDTHVAHADLARTVTIAGADIILTDEAGNNAGTLGLYRKSDGAKVLKGTYLPWNPTGDTEMGDVYLERVPDRPPKMH